MIPCGSGLIIAVQMKLVNSRSVQINSASSTLTFLSDIFVFNCLISQIKLDGKQLIAWLIAKKLRKFKFSISLTYI